MAGQAISPDDAVRAAEWYTKAALALSNPNNFRGIITDAVREALRHDFEDRINYYIGVSMADVIGGINE